MCAYEKAMSVDYKNHVLKQQKKTPQTNMYALLQVTKQIWRTTVLFIGLVHIFLILKVGGAAIIDGAINIGMTEIRT